MPNLIHVIGTTSSLVLSIIPPLLRLGYIDRIGCGVLGAVIGIVVALSSMQFTSDLLADKTASHRGAKFGSSFWIAEEFLI